METKSIYDEQVSHLNNKQTTSDEESSQHLIKVRELVTVI